MQVQDIQAFLSGLEGINDNAVLFTGINRSVKTKTAAAGKCPPSIPDAAEDIDVDAGSSDEQAHDIFMKAISITSDQCESIEMATRGQDSNTWIQQRRGRIMASDAHDIFLYKSKHHHSVT